MALEERIAQAFSGEREGDLRRGATREIGAINIFVVLNPSGIGVVRGGRGAGGAIISSTWISRAEGTMDYHASSHWDGISTEARICPSRMSHKNMSIFLSSGAAQAKEGTASFWPHSTRMWGAVLSTQIMSGGRMPRGKVSRRLRCLCWHTLNVVQ